MTNTDAYSESIQSHFDWSNIAPSMAIINALASLEGVLPRNLPTTVDGSLYDRVDPEALDALVTGERPIAISFAIADYQVHVDGSKLRICYE